MKALIPVLDESRKKPYYLQIYDHIKAAIMRGEITEGERLPSLRSLAASTGVSVTTIPDDITQYKKMITGSASSTDITGKVVMGSVYAKFVSTDNPDWYIEFEMDHVPFTADYPSVEPEGSEATIQFTCDAAIIAASGETPITAPSATRPPRSSTDTPPSASCPAGPLSVTVTQRGSGGAPCACRPQKGAA